MILNLLYQINMKELIKELKVYVSEDGKEWNSIEGALRRDEEINLKLNKKNLIENEIFKFIIDDIEKSIYEKYRHGYMGESSNEDKSYNAALNDILLILKEYK